MDPLKLETLDTLYEYVEVDLSGSRDRFSQLVEELQETGYLESCVCTGIDTYMLKAKSGLKWSTVSELSDPIKKKILLPLIENPQCFFVLVNTQRGKLRIIGKEMASWNYMTEKRVVNYLVVDNDRTLSEQSVNGLFSCFPVVPGKEESSDCEEKYNVKIYELSSNNKTSLNEIKTYIDAFAYNVHYKPPLIVVLSNTKQIEKLIHILHHVLNHPCSNLRIGGAWDEADKTYPPFRTRPFNVHGNPITFLDMLTHSSERLIRNGFVSATEGVLLEDGDEEYEECINAHHYQPEMDPEDSANYYAFHKSPTQKHIVSMLTRESNNSIADRVLTEHWNSHFNKPFVLSNGTTYHHKIILNSDSQSAEMIYFANNWKSKANVITFNMHGVKLYRNHCEPKHYSVRKQNLNKLIFYIYKMNNLHDKPLIILGRRKVDRGLGFHYAPRKSGSRILEIEGKDGVLHTDGFEGLIWTDMIMGNRIEHIPTAVQKVGRGAGIIIQCPQWSGEFHYWIDSETARHVEHHYKKVEKVAELSGTNTMLQAVTHACVLVPLVRHNHDVDKTLFRVVHGTTPEHTLEIVRDIITKVFGKEPPRRPQRDDASGLFKTSLNQKSEVVKLLDAIKKVPGAYGTNNGIKTYRRFYPAYSNIPNANSLHCVIPLIDPSYTDAMKVRIDTEYREYLKEVPQEGDIPV